MAKPITLPLAPHLPGGLVTPEQLRHLAQIAEKYEGTIKVAGNSLVILGLTPENQALALTELGIDSQSLSAKAVRSIAVCSGKPQCRRALQDSTSLGLELEKHFYGTELPGKLRIGVSACPNACSEIFIKDIGLYGTAAGYTLTVGGRSDRTAQAGHIIAEKIPPEKVLPLIGKILAYYQLHGKAGERIGQTISRCGFTDFTAYFGVNGDLI